MSSNVWMFSGMLILAIFFFGLIYIDTWKTAWSPTYQINETVTCIVVRSTGEMTCPNFPSPGNK